MRLLYYTRSMNILKVFWILLFPLYLNALSLSDEQGDLYPAAKKLLHLCDVPLSLSENELLPYLQKHWMQAGKERWEMKALYEDRKEAAIPLLREIGCIDELEAKNNHYDYALVLGATRFRMEKRLDFLQKQIEKGVEIGQIVLLSGDRKLDPEIEAFPKELKTEAELFIYLYENHPLYGKTPFTVVDSKPEFGRRPTTATTLRDWIATKPSPGRCLAVSCQPFVGYQEAVIKSILPHPFSVEAIGPALENPYPLAIYLDNFAKWLLYEKKR